MDRGLFLKPNYDTEDYSTVLWSKQGFCEVELHINIFKVKVTYILHYSRVKTIVHMGPIQLFEGDLNLQRPNYKD